MSATWSAPTVKNFNLDYLDEVHGVVRKDMWIGELNQEIVRQTKLFNKRAAKTYDIDVAWVDEDKNLAGMAALAGGAFGGCNRIARRDVRARDGVLWRNWRE